MSAGGSSPPPNRSRPTSRRWSQARTTWCATYSGPHGDYPLGVFCRKSLAQYLDVEDILLITRQGFEFFERNFEMPYAFGKYDQLFVPEFNAGAMENAGCVTFREDYIFRSRG